tara:strand:- start:52 stop:225 length:174 start_codon:yes stop_codon:yes gene_type:complete
MTVGDLRHYFISLVISLGCGGYWVANSHGQPYFIKLLHARGQTVAFFAIKPRHNTTD